MTTFVPVHSRDEQALLRELTHRIRNELVSSIGIVSAAAVRTENPEVKLALSHVVDLLKQHVRVHCLLAIPDRDGLIDAAGYIRKRWSPISGLCAEISSPRRFRRASLRRQNPVPGGRLVTLLLRELLALPSGPALR